MLNATFLTLGLAMAADIDAEAAVAVALAKHRADTPAKAPVNPAEWRTAKVDPVTVGADAKTDPRPLVGSYAAIYDRVAGGQTVFLSVGSDTAGFERCDDVPPSLRPGLYRCFPGVDGPKIEPVVTYPTVTFPVYRTGGT